MYVIGVGLISTNVRGGILVHELIPGCDAFVDLPSCISKGYQVRHSFFEISTHFGTGLRFMNLFHVAMRLQNYRHVRVNSASKVCHFR